MAMHAHHSPSMTKKEQLDSTKATVADLEEKKLRAVEESAALRAEAARLGGERDRLREVQTEAAGGAGGCGGAAKDAGHAETTVAMPEDHVRTPQLLIEGSTRHRQTL
eukprot:9486764-Pyramimonas_sp.AAC.1